MPVFRYRDISEMADVWREPGDPALFRAIARLWEMSAATAPRRYPPGVYPARDIEQSNRLSVRWELNNVRQFRARRGQVTRTAPSSAAEHMPAPTTPKRSE